ncbi:MAG: ParA family partition ATPase [Stappiaceae bacterium]
MVGRIITIAQQKGGSGKTTLAAHLAVAWAIGQDQEVAVLDVDPQGSLGEWFEMREDVLGETETGLVFRTASGWGARREARSMARDFPVVIVDTPPKSDTEAKPAIDAADLVLIPVQPTPIDYWATKSTVTMATNERTEALLILNRVLSRASLTEEMKNAISESGYPLADASLGNRTGFAASMGKGRSVQETMPSSKAADEIAALYRELKNHLE